MTTIEEDKLMENLELLRGKVAPEMAGTLDEAIEMAKLITGKSGLLKEDKNVIRGRKERPWIRVPDGYYNVEQTAEHFGVSKQAVYKWIETGKIKTAPSLRAGRGMLIPIDQFKPDKEKEQRSKLHKLRQKLSGGEEPFTVDEEEFPIERWTDGDLK